MKNAHTTVPNFSMAAPDSTLTAICGRKGCGKTALIETLMGLRPLAKGYVSVDGELLQPATVVFFRSRMAYVPQTLQAPGQLTANELLQLYADCSKRSHQTLRKDDVQQLWPALQLDDALGPRPSIASLHLSSVASCSALPWGLTAPYWWPTTLRAVSTMRCRTW